MRILFISEELGAAELTLAFLREGHDVKLFIHNSLLQDCFSGLVEKTPDWKKELAWVGKEGLVVFDDTGFGEEQDALRQAGYRVVGGCGPGDKIEEDREYGQRVLKENGIEPLPSFNFKHPHQAIDFIREHSEDIWVVKKNGGHISHYSYITELPSQEDAIGILRHYGELGIEDVNLQKKVEGIEIGIARYFNGKDWVGPIEFNIEHKGLMPGDIGPKTPEMGTVMWYSEDVANRLFRSTLAKLKAYLSAINFRGDIGINFIVNQTEYFPLEFCARFGNPATALQMELHLSPWSEFLGAVADGQEYALSYRKGYGVIITVAVPPFPYRLASLDESASGLPISFRGKISEEEMKHFYFEEARKGASGLYQAEGPYGCAMHVGGYAGTLREARARAYENVSKVCIPKMFYRWDIGQRFEEENFQKLKDWGWI